MNIKDLRAKALKIDLTHYSSEEKQSIRESLTKLNYSGLSPQTEEQIEQEINDYLDQKLNLRNLKENQ